MNSENTAKETILACFFIGYICLLETKTWWSLFIPLLVVVVLDLLIWDFLPYLKKKCKQRREKILFSNSKEGYFINYQYFYLHYKRDEVSAKEIKQFLSFYQGPVLGFMAHIQGILLV